MDDELRDKIDEWLKAWEIVDRGMSKFFPDRAAAVYFIHYARGYALDDVGRMAGVTRERIRQLFAKYVSEHPSDVSRETGTDEPA